MKLRALYIGICSLLLAGIVHIVIIMLIPYVSSKDAARIISKNGTVNNVVLIGETGQIKLSEKDPFFKLALCRYDLSQAGLQISAEKIDSFWSASVFSSTGNVIYSFNDRTAIANKLELLLVNSIQRADLRQSKPEELETSILVEVPANNGFFLLRALITDDSKLEAVNAFLDKVTCEPYATR